MIESDKLQKVLANHGLGSRRAMEVWISESRVKVNGRIAKLGDRVTQQDKIVVDGSPLARSLEQQRLQCLVYHKPEGLICSRKDNQGRPTVFEALPELDAGRWISVGRLDINTSGLLLFTNDGELANKLMHPSTGLTRRYMARIRGELSAEQILLITKKGVLLDDKLAKFEEVKVMDRLEPGANNWIEVSIKEGRYREVRRILEAVNHPVSRLKRTQYGTVKLSPRLRKGQTELMAPMQLEKLLTSHGLDELVPQVRLRSEPKRTARTKTNTKAVNKRDDASSSKSEVRDARSTRRAKPVSKSDKSLGKKLGKKTGKNARKSWQKATTDSVWGQQDERSGRRGGDTRRTHKSSAAQARKGRPKR